MADSKISDLTELTVAPDPTDVLPITDASAPATTKKITVANISKAMANPSTTAPATPTDGMLWWDTDDTGGSGVAWTAYTPVWTGSSGTTTIGDGTLAGRYTQVGKIVHFTINLTLGATSNTTNGEQWRLSLPVTASSSIPAYTGLGNWSGENDAVLGYGGITSLMSTTTIGLFYTVDSVLTWVTHDTPFIWASGDWIRISGTYEAA